MLCSASHCPCVITEVNHEEHHYFPLYFRFWDSRISACALAPIKLKFRRLNTSLRIALPSAGPAQNLAPPETTIIL
jgi:hypothetical protein